MQLLTHPYLMLMILSLCLACQPNEQAKEEKEEPMEERYPTTGTIERLDAAIDSLIPADAKIEILADGFDWSEGPLWIDEGGYLLFSDIPPNRIYKWKEGVGKSLYLEPSGYTSEIQRGGEVGSNGLLLNAVGQLVLCQHGDRRMARMDASLDTPKANYVSLAATWEGKRFNSPNDAAYHSDGDLYFTDPPYGLEKNVDDPAKEIDFQGVYKLSTDGTVSLLTDEITRPNGIGFSPDEKILYVSSSDPEKAIWMAYNLKDDGTIENGRIFFDATPWVAQKKGLPDGLTVDPKGNLWATGPGGVLIFSPEGRHLGTIHTGEATSNCTFGDNGNSLYITADMYLMRVKLEGD